MLIAVSVYAGVAFIVFVASLCVARWTKIDIIGNNVRLGICNSLFLSLFWPVFLIAAIAGWIFDMVMFIKEI